MRAASTRTASTGSVGVAQLGERGEGAAVQLLPLLDDAVGGLHRAAAQPPLDEVDVAALEPGERRAQEREELAARPAEPREAQQRRQRLAERRLVDANLAVDRVRDAERAERGLERCANAVDARADDADLLRRRPAAEEREQLLADELERAARAGALEEPNGAVDRNVTVRLVGEERALEMRECGRRDVAVARFELLDVARRDALEILGGAAQRCEHGTPRLVRERHAHVGAARERLEQRPLRPGQILEAVRVDRLAVPRGEVGLQPLCRAAAQEVAVPEAEPVELGPVRRVERCEVAFDVLRVEQARLELADRAQELVGEAAEPGRRREAVERRGRRRRGERGARAASARRPAARRGRRTRCARRRRRTCRSCRRGAQAGARGARARPGRRPTGSAR